MVSMFFFNKYFHPCSKQIFYQIFSSVQQTNILPNIFIRAANKYFTKYFHPCSKQIFNFATRKQVINAPHQLTAYQHTQTKKKKKNGLGMSEQSGYETNSSCSTQSLLQASIERDCYPSPLNYYNFPKSCCT